MSESKPSCAKATAGKTGTFWMLADSLATVVLLAAGFVFMMSGFYWELIRHNWQYGDHDLIVAILFYIVAREARHAKR